MPTGEILRELIATIEPAGIAEATRASQYLMRKGIAAQHPPIAELAARLCAACHSSHPQLMHKSVVVVAADHGVASVSSSDLIQKEGSTTISAMQALARGEGPLQGAVRSADAALLLVDAGVLGASEVDMGSSVRCFRTGDGSENFCDGPAMTHNQVRASLQTGVALCFSLANTGLDVLALGNIGVGSDLSSAALVAAITGVMPTDLSPEDRKRVTRALSTHHASTLEPSEVLSCFGGFETAVMTGMMLAAASLHIPVVLDNHGTSAAALLAEAMSPRVRGYLIASHGGGSSAHEAALKALHLSPLFAATTRFPAANEAAAMAPTLALPMLDAAARLMSDEVESI